MTDSKVAALAELSPKPLPPFYCAYLLRSTVRPNSTYIGSTPDPRRRINQHNGISVGGARRTKKNDLRPWEMTVIVHGFASQVAALQFEWAWQNSHKSKKIEEEDRAAVTATKSRAGAKPKSRKSKPRASMQLHLKNLLLLVTGKAFVRWGLRVRFFCQDVYEAWESVVEEFGGGRRLPKVLIDRRMVVEESDVESGDEVLVPGSQVSELTGRKNKHKGDGKGGVLGIDITNEHVLPHLRKSHELLTGPSPAACHFCRESSKVPAFKSLLTCPTPSCKLAAHIHCFSAHFLSMENAGTSEILPDCGTCPSCGSLLEWQDLIREYKLRLSTTLPKEKAVKVVKVRKESTKTTKTKAEPTTKGTSKAKSKTDSIIDAILKEEEDYAPLAPIPFTSTQTKTSSKFESDRTIEISSKDEPMENWLWQEPDSDDEMIFEDSLKYGLGMDNNGFDQEDDVLDDTWEDKIDETVREGSVQPEEEEEEELVVPKKKRGRPPKRLSTVPEDFS